MHRALEGVCASERLHRNQVLYQANTGCYSCVSRPGPIAQTVREFACHAQTQLWLEPPESHYPAVAVNGCHFSTGEVEAGGTEEAQCYSWLHTNSRPIRDA